MSISAVKLAGTRAPRIGVVRAVNVIGEVSPREFTGMARLWRASGRGRAVSMNANKPPCAATYQRHVV